MKMQKNTTIRFTVRKNAKGKRDNPVTNVKSKKILIYMSKDDRYDATRRPKRRKNK